jgi:hypothetical protein
MKSKAAAHINYILYRGEGGRDVRKQERVKAERRDDRDQALDEIKVDSKRIRAALEEEKPTNLKTLERGDEVEPGKKPGPRQMYSENSDHYSGAQLKKDIDGLGRNDVTHKFMISAGHNDVDTKVYVREILTELGRAKGQELRYGFVVHENTDHKHAHVVLLGRDKENGQVWMDKNDHMKIRAFGDRFLEREHNIERVLDRDMEDFCRTRNLNPMFEKERGEEFYERLYKSDKRKDKDATREHLEWEKFNNDWKKFVEDKEGTENRPYLGRSEYHDLGRMSDLSALMNNDLQKEIWQDIGQNHPEMKDLADETLKQLEKDKIELQQDVDRKTKAGDPFKAIDRIADQINSEQKQFQHLMKYGLGPNDSHSGIDLSRVDDADKIEIGDKTYTKFDTSTELLDADAFLREDQSNRIPKDQYSKLWTWIGAKEKFGEDCFGEVPRREGKELDKGLERTESTEPTRDEPTIYEIDYFSIEAADRLLVSDTGRFSKYSSSDELKELEDRAKIDDNLQLSQDDQSKLRSWIDAKESRGEDCFGQPPMAEVDFNGHDGHTPEEFDKPLEKVPDQLELKQLDEFVGFSEGKQLDLDREQHPLLAKLETQDRAEESLDDLLGFEPEEGPELEQQLTIDRGLMFETPLEPEETDRDERDDGSDLFDMGIN